MNEPAPAPIPVHCARCSACGTAGAGDFAHLADLLDFTPVEQKVKRVDGWTPQRQRDFILALSATGSKRRAAAAIGMAAFGIDQLMKKPEAESFALAFDRAMAIAAASDASSRAARLEHIKGAAPPAAAAEEEDDSAEALEMKLEVAERLAVKFLAKVQAERASRLAGEIVAADFYLRQVTALEVALDLLAQECGYSGFQLLAGCRRSGYNLFAIAETPFTRLLDEERRRLWAEEGEPDRPEHPPQRYLDHRTDPATGLGFSLQPTETTGPASDPPPGVDAEKWARMSYDGQKAMWAEQHRRDAEAQISWESQAVAEHKAQARSAT